MIGNLNLPEEQPSPISRFCHLVRAFELDFGSVLAFGYRSPTLLAILSLFRFDEDWLSANCHRAINNRA